MQNFTFTFRDGEDMELVMTLRGDTHTHTELRQAFINFLRGVGYVIPDDEDLV